MSVQCFSSFIGTAWLHSQKKNASGLLVYQRAGAQACWNSMSVCCRDCYSQDSLHGHGVTTVAPIMEKAASAVPLTVVVVGGMNIVLSPKRSFKACELNALGFFGVLFCFGNFIDHA
jgi:hypothetical protein